MIGLQSLPVTCLLSYCWMFLWWGWRRKRRMEGSCQLLRCSFHFLHSFYCWMYGSRSSFNSSSILFRPLSLFDSILDLIRSMEISVQSAQSSCQFHSIHSQDCQSERWGSGLDFIEEFLIIQLIDSVSIWFPPISQKSWSGRGRDWRWNGRSFRSHEVKSSQDNHCQCTWSVFLPSYIPFNQELPSQLRFVSIAGFDTTANTLTFLCLLLAEHQEIQVHLDLISPLPPLSVLFSRKQFDLWYLISLLILILSLLYRIFNGVYGKHFVSILMHHR